MLKIRAMVISDYEVVYDLWKRAGLQLKKSDEREEIELMLLWNPDTCIVGLTDGQIVAAVMGGFDGRRGMVHHLAVDPTYQGRGYGRQMMDELAERFTAMGVMKINLFVLDTNEKVLGFYDAIGYSRRHELITLSKTLIEE